MQNVIVIYLSILINFLRLVISFFYNLIFSYFIRFKYIYNICRSK